MFCGKKQTPLKNLCKQLNGCPINRRIKTFEKRRAFALTDSRASFCAARPVRRCLRGNSSLFCIKKLRLRRHMCVHIAKTRKSRRFLPKKCSSGNICGAMRLFGCRNAVFSKRSFKVRGAQKSRALQGALKVSTDKSAINDIFMRTRAHKNALRLLTTRRRGDKMRFCNMFSKERAA